MRAKLLHEERKRKEKTAAKHAEFKTNRLVASARKKSLEEIFDVLLASADMSRELAKQEKNGQPVPGALKFRSFHLAYSVNKIIINYLVS